jgi:DNA-3-methyladenine glycosylase
MFGPAGHAYVYPIHAGHCFNVVTGEEGAPEAVLIRAVEPKTGIKTIKNRRQHDHLRQLTTGPSRLCQAFGFTRDQDGIDLTVRRKIWIEQVEYEERIPIMISPRIGVTSGQSLELRFVWRDNLFVSGPKKYRSHAHLTSSFS